MSSYNVKRVVQHVAQVVIGVAVEITRQMQISHTRTPFHTYQKGRCQKV